MAASGIGTLKLVGTIFFCVGLLLLAVAGWSGNRQYTILKSWPEVQAEVVNSQLVHYRDSKGNAMYKPAIDFRYRVDGKEYTVPSSSNYSSSSYDEMKGKVDTYAPGTRHPIRYNPADPRDMRFEVGYNFGFFFLPVLFGGMGIVFTGVSIALLYASRSERARACPSCGQSVAAGQKFCPNCAAPLRSR